MIRDFEQFHEALEQPPEERHAFVRARHADDPERVDRLLRLLDAHAQAEARETRGPLSSGAISSGALSTGALGPAHAGTSPEWIGRYRILERLGEGGMGVVYAAEQTEPLRRRVAVKVIKLGMDTREVIARFDAERQALALMDHPGVAKVLDAGVTEEGRPFFVMELVRGLPLVDYCTSKRLELRDRLQLFVRVCSAVQHAHHKGIIHRDLKPSNILVADLEGQPVPKVIDFGVAKAVANRLTDRTVHTELGRLIGTPEYMSPEQADESGADIDTRTDVYALGVILFQLLTGELPFDSGQLRDGGHAEIRRVIREVEPPKPSTKLSERATRTANVKARLPLTDSRTIRGELDWIVLRAMAKDRARRYETAIALAEDVERYLSDRPVLAGPPSITYTLRKFMRRHRIATTVIALVAMSVVLGAVGLTVGLVRAREAEQLATERAEHAQAAAGFLERVLFQADPEVGGESLSLLEVIERAGESVSAELEPYPRVEASVRESIGVSYRRRSMFEPAAPQLTRSLQLRRDHLGESHPETARSYIALADLRFEHEGSIDEALSMLGRAAAIYRDGGLDGSAREAWLLLDVGIVQLAGDRLIAAEQSMERCRDLLARDRGADHPDVSRAVRELASIALARGDLELATTRAREAVALCTGEGERYLEARAKLVLAEALLAAGQLDPAGALLAETAAQLAHTVGDRHIRIAEHDVVLAALHHARREFDSAQVYASRCEALRTELLHPRHPALLEARLWQQRARIGLGEAAAADEELRKIGEALAERAGPTHRLCELVARARLEAARALDDQRLIELRTERLEGLRRRRTARIAQGKSK